MRRSLIPLLALSFILVAACADGRPDGDDAADAATVPADSITKRQRDSVIGASRLPGAGGVRGALEASDAAAARAAAHDSVNRQP